MAQAVLHASHLYMLYILMLLIICFSVCTAVLMGLAKFGVYLSFWLTCNKIFIM